MPIRTIGTGFKALECKFQPFQQDSKHSNANSNHSNRIRSTRMSIPTIWSNSNHLNGIGSSQMQIPTIRTGYWKHWNANLNNLNEIPTIRMVFEALECQFEPLERDSKHLNAHCNHLNGLWSTPMQIPTIQTGFEALECKMQSFE